MATVNLLKKKVFSIEALNELIKALELTERKYTITSIVEDIGFICGPPQDKRGWIVQELE
jgi:hypothetical protein